MVMHRMMYAKDPICWAQASLYIQTAASTCQNDHETSAFHCVGWHQTRSSLAQCESMPKERALCHFVQSAARGPWTDVSSEKHALALVLTLQAVHTISSNSKPGLHNLLHLWVSRDSLKLTGVGRPTSLKSS